MGIHKKYVLEKYLIYFIFSPIYKFNKKSINIEKILILFLFYKTIINKLKIFFIKNKKSDIFVI